MWVRENRIDAFEVLYEIKDSTGLIVLPEWIDRFLPDESVPPSGWQVPKNDETWVELVSAKQITLDHAGVGAYP